MDLVDHGNRSATDPDPEAAEQDRASGAAGTEGRSEEVTPDELVERTRTAKLAGAVGEIVTYTIVAGAVAELGDVAMKAIAGLMGVGWQRSGPLHSFDRGSRRPGLRATMREPGGATTRLEFVADPDSDGDGATSDEPEHGIDSEPGPYDGSRPPAVVRAADPPPARRVGGRGR